MADSSTAAGSTASDSKGKGKPTEPESHSTDMDIDDSSSEEEIEEGAAVADEPDEDNMEEIDLNNIIEGGRRTRGRNIDFAKAAAELPEEDDDEEDDDDFQAPVEDEDSKMED